MLLSLLSIAVIIVMTILASLLLDLSLPIKPINAGPTLPATFNLPTTASPTITIGPSLPQSIYFVPEKPIKGYSDCQAYGFRGTIKADDLPETEVVVWAEEKGLVSLDTVDSAGYYNLEFAGQPSLRKLWLQVYQNDVPVSAPISLEIQIDCQNGFQIYQIDWRTSSEARPRQ